MANTKKAKKGEAAQVGRFGLVGLLNTAVDFIVLNFLVRTVLPRDQVYATVFGHPVTGFMIAGVISGTLAMVNSFIFNQRFTFKARQVTGQAIVMFFAITMAGLYIIRPLVLNFFSSVWTWPAEVAYSIGQFLHLPFDQAFYQDNVALAAAIALVLVYNYIAYKRFVFKQ